MFEKKGLSECISHLSYKDQGIDREPMVHLGHVASALEKRGIRTEKGDHNRAVQQRNLNLPAEGVASGVRNQKLEIAGPDAANEERAALKEAGQENPEMTPKSDTPTITEAATTPEYGVTKLTTIDLFKAAEEAKLEEELRKIRQAQKLAQHIEKPSVPDKEPPYASDLERGLKAEKAMQHIEKTREPYDAEKTAKHMNTLKESYAALEKEKITTMTQHNKIPDDISRLEYLVEYMDEHAANIEALRERAARLRELRGNLRMLDFGKKKEADAQIAQAEQDLGRARDFFSKQFHADPDRALETLKRLQEEILAKKRRDSRKKRYNTGD
jgi:chemotaxis protein histidine kinase CheA